MNKLQKGVSLYLAVIIMLILLAIALGVSTILIGQIKTIRGMGNSVSAFYAADTGIETELKKIFKDNNPTDFGVVNSYSGFLDLDGDGIPDPNGNCPDDLLLDDGNACYEVCIVAPGSSECGTEACSASLRCIRSKGFYKGTSRAIEASQD